MAQMRSTLVIGYYDYHLMTLSFACFISFQRENCGWLSVCVSVLRISACITDLGPFLMSSPLHSTAETWKSTTFLGNPPQKLKLTFSLLLNFTKLAGNEKFLSTLRHSLTVQMPRTFMSSSRYRIKADVSSILYPVCL